MWSVWDGVCACMHEDAGVCEHLRPVMCGQYVNGLCHGWNFHHFTVSPELLLFLATHPEASGAGAYHYLPITLSIAAGRLPCCPLSISTFALPSLPFKQAPF